MKPSLGAALSIGLLALAPGCGTPTPPNLLLVTFDTTRADFLGCYGKASARTPVLDRLAAEGTLFEDCVTAAPITTPSHSTIFTGTYPLFHGVRDNGRFRLPESRLTLAEVLKARGYATGAAIGSFPLQKQWGLHQGFDFYDDHITIASEDRKGGRLDVRSSVYFDERPASRVNDAILPWLRENAGRPFFAFVHYWDPHQPHIPPAPFDQLYAHDPYQGEIAYADQCLGVLIDELRRQGVYDRTVIAMAADHGEGRGEHGEDTHSMLLYQAVLHVPLIIRAPGMAAGQRVTRRVGTVDIMPTLLDLLATTIPAEVQGRSLVPAMRYPSQARGAGDTYYSETLSPRLAYGWGDQRALFEGRHKYLFGPHDELFDLASDPGELRDLTLVDKALSARMLARLEAFVQRFAAPAAAEALQGVDRASQERMAALGYLSGSGPQLAVDERLSREGESPQAHVASVNLWSQCKMALQRRDYLKARDIALGLVREQPTNGFFSALLATAHLGLGHVAAAASVAEQGPITIQNDAVFLDAARLLFTQQRGAARAMALARRIAAATPSAPAHYLLAEMEGQSGRIDAHEAGLRRALEADPRFAPARRSLAVILAQSGRLAAAAHEFGELATANPLDPAAHLNYATALLQTGEFTRARAQIQRALDIDPRYWKAHLALLALHVDNHERAQAAALLARLERECPDRALVAQARRLLEGA